MKLKLRFYFFFCCCSLAVFGQEETCSCCLKGQVLDAETKEPIAHATVRVSGGDTYVQTNKKGEYLITGKCPENYTLEISCLGYVSSAREHHHEHDADPHFYLSQDITGLGEVIIEAQRSKEQTLETLSQVTLTKEEILTSPTPSLGQSVSGIEGVTFASVGTNVQLPIIHGLSGNRILILNNGLKHSFQNWGMDHAPEIDINGAHAITVIKGAAGVRFGPEALSGAILVESNPLLLDKPFFGTARSSFQTNGLGTISSLELGQGMEKWSYAVNGSFTKIGDRRAPDYLLTNTGKQEEAFSFGVLHHIENWDVKVYYSFINQNLGLLRSSVSESPALFVRSINSTEPLIIEPFSYSINQPNQKTQHHLAKAEATYWNDELGKFNFRAGIQFNKRDEFDVRRNADRPIIDLDLLTYDYQLEWEHPDWKGLDGFIGVQYFSQNNDNNPGTLTTPFIPNYNSERYSAFVIEKIRLGDNLLEAGVRFDVETNDVRGREPNGDIFRDNYRFTNLTASIGYEWRLSNNSKFKTNIGTAFRTPNIAELFSFGQQGFRSTFGLLRFTDTDAVLSTAEVTLLDQSDVDLERGYKFTGEFRTATKTNSHLVTGYVNYIDNFVFDRPLGIFGTVRGPQPAFIIDQAEALFLGVDYSWKKEINESLSIVYGASYLWTRNIGENEPLINQPPISTKLDLQLKQGDFWIFSDSQWSLKTSYTFKQFQAPRTVSPTSIVDGLEEVTIDSEIFDFLDAPEGYFLLDASWNFTLDKFKGTLTAQNLLNTGYRNYLNEFRYFADEQGINIALGVTYTF